MTLNSSNPKSLDQLALHMPYSCVAHRPDPNVAYYEVYKNIGRKYTRVKGSDDPNDILASAFNTLTPTRTVQEKLLVKGNFDLLPAKVSIPSNIIFELQGIIYQPANLLAPNHVALEVKDKTNVTFIGGQIKGLGAYPTNLIRADNSTYVNIHRVQFKDSFSQVLYWNECVGGIVSDSIFDYPRYDGASIEGCEGISILDNTFLGDVHDRFILVGIGAQNCLIKGNKLFKTGVQTGVGISILSSYLITGINPSGRLTKDIYVVENVPIKGHDVCIEAFSVYGHTTNLENVYLFKNGCIPTATGKAIHIYKEAGSAVDVKNLLTYANTLDGGNIGIHVNGQGIGKLIDDVITSTTPIRLDGASALKIQSPHNVLINTDCGGLLFLQSQWLKTLTPLTFYILGSSSPYMIVYEDGCDFSTGSTSGSSVELLQSGYAIDFAEAVFTSLMYLWYDTQQKLEWGLQKDTDNYAIFYTDVTTVAGYFKYKLVTGGVVRGDADTNIPIDTNTPHDFKIEARNDRTVFYIDGVQKASLNYALGLGANPRMYAYTKENVEKGFTINSLGVRPY